MRGEVFLVLLITLLLGIFLVSLATIRSANNSLRCTALQVADDTLMTSLVKYETWITQYRDIKWVYIRERGYPMYLYSFGIMYLRLYELTCDLHYLREFQRIVDGVEKIRNSDWTWSFYDGTDFSTHKDAKSSLYNAMFAELFIEAWLLTGNPKYKLWAGAAIEKIKDILPSHRTYNYFFLPFTAIAYYCHKIGCDEELIVLGKRLFDHALSGYDQEAGRWYYNPAEKNRDFYNGHSAFYQMGQIAWFLDKISAVRESFPIEYETFIWYTIKNAYTRQGLGVYAASWYIFLF